MSNYYINSNANSPGNPAIEKINVQTGTSPVVPTANTITFNGAVVAAGTHPVRTDGTGVSTMALEVQISQAIASTDATKIGLSAFKSSQFSVDANGFVSLTGSVGLTITGTTGGPLSPTAGNWNLFGATHAAGSIPVSVNGAVSTETVTVQLTQAISSTDATKVGLAAFDSSEFKVDANGFVQLANLFEGSATTVGAVTANVMTIPLGGAAGTYQFEARVAAFNASTPASAGYNVYGTFRTDGTTATLVGNQDVYNEEAALVTADAYFIASANNAILQVLGVAALTIDWIAETELTIST
jgi:hypothetical protein